MMIHHRNEEKIWVTKLAVARLILWLAKRVRSKWVTWLINHFCYFGTDRSDRLQIVGQYHQHLLMYLDVHSWVERKILCAGYFERWIDDFLCRSLKPGYVALDVGANVGCHTLVMADAVGATGRVLAFEPNPSMRARLCANVLLNRLENVKVLEYALGDTRGQMDLFVPAPADYNQGLGSLHRANLDGPCNTVPVQITTLDELVHENPLPRIDLVKIDVEGHEFQVFLGARATLLQFRPIIIFEFSQRQWLHAGVMPEQVESLFSELGYELFVMRRGTITSIRYGVSAECDLLALPACH